MVLNISLVRQWCASFTAALCMAIAGSGFTWLTPLAVQFTSKDSPIPMTEMQRSWVTACASIGNTLSCIPIGIIAHKWGRKPTLLLAGPLALFGWILMMATRSLGVLYIAALIHGYAMATAFCICSIYIAEIASPRIRGTLCGQFMTLFYLGCIYVDVIASITTYQQYLYLLALIPAIYTVLFYFMPETPHHLLKAKRDDKALKVFQWLSGKSNEFIISEQMKEMKTSLKTKFSWKAFLFHRHHRRALTIVTIAYCLKCFSGQISLQVFITQIFYKLTNTETHGILLTTILNTLLCITCFISGFISDTLGRRPIMYTTSFASGVFNIVISVYFFIYDSNVEKLSTASIWIIFTSMSLSLILGNASMSVFLPTVSTEYFTTESRPLGSAIVHAIAGLASFISIIIYQSINVHIGVYFNFIIFALTSFGASILIYFFVRETSRKTLERIQKEMESN